MTTSPDPSTDKTGAAAPFDFEAFINGTEMSRDTVTLYRVDHSKKIAQLTAEHDRIPDTSDDQRESDTGPNAERAKLAEQIAALRDEMTASGREFEIRALTPDELKDLMEQEWTAYKQISVQTSDHGTWVSPNPLTQEQAKRLADAIGTGQWGELMSTANALIDHKAAVPDFSPSVSRTLAQQVSFMS